MKRATIATLAALATLAAAGSAQATIYTLGYPDVVLDFHDSGAGPIAGPYGGDYYNEPGYHTVSTSVILGFNDVTYNGFVSLPTGSYITVGFNDEIITDGPGDDIYLAENGPSEELALIYVSKDLTNFDLLGVAQNSRSSFVRRLSFDLARIGYGANDIVRAIRIEGLDNGGASPGFDINTIQVSFTSLVPGDPNAQSGAPEPAAWASMILGFGLAGAMFRRRESALSGARSSRRRPSGGRPGSALR